MRRRSACRRGFTLVELSLASAISLAFISAFFFGFQTYLVAVDQALSSVRFQVEATGLLDTITSEIAGSTGITGVSATNVTFTVGANTIEYQLANPAAGSVYNYIQRRVNAGAWADVGPKNLITNGHPFANTLKDFAAADVTAPTAVPCFINVPAVAGAGGNVRQVRIYLVIQQNDRLPPRYLIGSATPLLAP